MREKAVLIGDAVLPNVKRDHQQHFSGLETQDAIDKAVITLEGLENEVRKQASLARNDLSTLAEKTATKAAELLTSKFSLADDAANAAAGRYEKAARMLGFKTFAVIFLFLTFCCAAAWFWVCPLLPSRDELDFRRAQLVEMEKTAAMLEKKGVNVEWTDCRVGTLKRTKTCFRVGEILTEEGTGYSYAVPYSSLK